MKTITSIKSIHRTLQKLRKAKKTIGLVPTMGYLHDGHCALLRRCRKENDIVVLSIFVNPTQFGPREDYRTYPRDKKRDVLLAKKENVDIIFYPTEQSMYPTRYLTFVEVNEIQNSLCGHFRSGHFKGVTTVVAKLLNIISPDRLYLGQKDAQQCIILRQLVRDLNYFTDVCIIPTVREKDGLALSSRNVYLSNKQRAEAAIIYQALSLAKKLIKDHLSSINFIKTKMRQLILQETSAKIDYIEFVDPNTAIPLTKIHGKILIAIAVRFGQTRLIDNIIVDA